MAKAVKKPSVRVYSTKTCPWCHKAKEFLREHRISFQDIDVGENDKARDEMIEKSGQMGVPVIEIDDTVIVGYDREAMEKALGLNTASG